MSWAGRFVVFLVLCTAACTGENERPLFKLLSSEATGVTFANTVTTNDSLNVQTDVYVYNGAGVGVGDIDNDGLADLFFTGNMVSSRLYLNRGAMRFDDITERAGVGTTRWATGVAMVDINTDGFLDIYVAVSGPQWSEGKNRANLLFVNNRNRTFTEAAAQYGVADTGFTTHAAFLDYDRDGCLDLFLLNNSPKDFARGVTGHPTGMRATTPGSYNELYRNDCGTAGKLTNVSREAGILRDAGFGLGVVVSDLNRDGWPDIYVSNDVAPTDVVYVNNRDGTFTNQSLRWLKHASFSGMGVDIADFNNDGWPDILQTDMLPRTLSGRKKVSGHASYASRASSRSRGFRDDYAANTLQLSSGAMRDGDVIFSDIANMAGVAATEWSWSALFADFDNDGHKDVFITNGYPKALNDLDYLGAAFGARQRGDTLQLRRLLKDLPSYEGPNSLFRNNGDLTFTDMAARWGLAQPGYSYGAAYADLDNDGRLDLVVNNLNAPAFIYQNRAPNGGARHYLAVRLQGEIPRERTAGIGAKVTVTAGGRKQLVYYSPYRGYMSTMDDRAHFGLGTVRRVDSLEVEWPDGRYQLLTDLEADRLLIVRQAHATRQTRGETSAPGQLFQRLRGRGPEHMHPSSVASDFSVQPLLPYALSSQGPVLAVADVNGDSLEDIFIGGSKGAGGRLLTQRKDGSFAESTRGQPWDADNAHEDWGAAFLDANGDGRMDLYVASGGYLLAPSSALLQDRLYINQGGGRFARDSAALPFMLTSTATVQPGDFNADGRPDLFVGGRLTPRKYPYPARSHLLRNEGGRFTDVTATVAPELGKPAGMITDAVWIDFDGDGRLDLVTAGEWMPIEFHRNDGTQLRNVTRSTGLPPLRGWWYSLAAADFDNDGDQDLVAGNLGLNTSYTTTKESPLGVYANNFTANQTTDIVLTQKIGGVEYPVSGMAQLGREVYTTAVKFPTHGSFARATIPQLFAASRLEESLHYEVDTFASVYLHNEGRGRFSVSHLPSLAQISPIRGIIPHDVDGDGNQDLIIAGNLYDVEPNTPRADAGNGLWLKGDGRGHFAPVSPAESGFLAPSNVAGLTLVNTAAGPMVLVANTGDSLQVYGIGRR